jgi:hypothetical protein
VLGCTPTTKHDNTPDMEPGYDARPLHPKLRLFRGPIPLNNMLGSCFFFFLEGVFKHIRFEFIKSYSGICNFLSYFQNKLWIRRVISNNRSQYIWIKSYPGICNFLSHFPKKLCIWGVISNNCSHYICIIEFPISKKDNRCMLVLVRLFYPIFLEWFHSY